MYFASMPAYWSISREFFWIEDHFEIGSEISSGDKDDNDGFSAMLVSLQLWTSENQGDEGETGDPDN